MGLATPTVSELSLSEAGAGGWGLKVEEKPPLSVSRVQVSTVANTHALFSGGTVPATSGGTLGGVRWYGLNFDAVSRFVLGGKGRGS